MNPKRKVTDKSSGLPLEEVARLFGDESEVMVFSEDIVIDHDNHQLTVRAERQSIDAGEHRVEHWTEKITQNQTYPGRLCRLRRSEAWPDTGAEECGRQLVYTFGAWSSMQFVAGDKMLTHGASPYPALRFSQALHSVLP